MRQVRSSAGGEFAHQRDLCCLRVCDGVRPIDLDLDIYVQHFFQQPEFLSSAKGLPSPVELRLDEAVYDDPRALERDRDRRRTKLAAIQRVGGPKHREELHHRLATVAATQDAVEAHTRHGAAMISREI